MNAKRRNFPLGIHSFEEIRTSNYQYVDKTDLVYELVSTGKNYFLSRPRRLGKSLLINTLKSYFQGKKHLFKGLAMENLETEWKERPVFHISMYQKELYHVDQLKALLEKTIVQWEEIYGKSDIDLTFSGRFQYVIEQAYKQSGEQVAILIDERHPLAS